VRGEVTAGDARFVQIIAAIGGWRMADGLVCDTPARIG
jgi:hypothetical protein